MCTICVIKALGDFVASAIENMKIHGHLKLIIPTISLCTADPNRDNSCDPSLDQRRRKQGRELQFPGRNYREGQGCIVLLRVVRLVLENLELGTNITTRDIYYQDVELFRSQERVAAAIEKLCRNTGVPRSLFRIMPSPKGLIVADLEVVLHDPNGSTGSTGQRTRTVALNRYNGPSLIPVGQEIVGLRVPEICVRPEYILIIEKEGVFSHIHAALPEAILITGKGFPDHYTRKFLYSLHRHFPDLPIYGLVDSDVHGIQILRTYQNSGQNTLEFHYPINKVEFLGVSIFDYTDGWVDITTREYKLIMSMLQKDWILDDKHAKWRREVQRQMVMGKKVEMNILDRSHLTTLVKYVRSRVRKVQSEAVEQIAPVAAPTSKAAPTVPVRPMVPESAPAFPQLRRSNRRTMPVSYAPATLATY